MLKAEHLAVVLFAAFRLVVVVPWLSYLSLRTWRVRDSQAMRKRRARTMIVMSVWIMWYLSSQSFRLISAIMPSFRNSAAERTANHSLILTMVPYFWVRLQRSWLLFHDLKISRATAKQEWIALLTDAYETRSELVSDSSNSTLSNEDATLQKDNEPTPAAMAAVLDHALASVAEEEHRRPSWFLAHWQTYGNHHWLLKRALFAGLIHAGLLYAIFQVSLSIGVDLIYAHTCTVITVNMITAIQVVLGFYAPNVDDATLLRQELLLGSYLGTAFQLMLVVLVFIIGIVGVSLTGLTVLTTIVLDGYLLCDACLFLYWIPHQLSKKGLITMPSLINRSLISTDSSSVGHQAPSHRPSVSKDGLEVRKVMLELLNDNDGIQLLITHMMREVSVECLLSVIEFYQFKVWICTNRCSELNKAGLSAEEIGRQLREIVEADRSSNESRSLLSATTTTSNNNGRESSTDPDHTPDSSLDCPSTLRRMEFGQWILPRCVKLSGSLRRLTEVERRHPSRHPIIRTVLSLNDKYISQESSLQINVSFLTTLKLKREMATLNMRSALCDRTSRDLRTLMDKVSQTGSNSSSNSSDDELSNAMGYDSDGLAGNNDNKEDHMESAVLPAAFEYDAFWMHNVSHIFDQCIDEMLGLIQASVRRLMQTDDYHRWREISGLGGLHPNASV